MVRPKRPERNRAARSFRQLRRFHHVINSDRVFGTHRRGAWRQTAESTRLVCLPSRDDPWNTNSDSKAGLVVNHLGTSLMEMGNGGDKAETEPIARRVAASFKPVKALEDVLAFIEGNSGPVIRDRNERTVIAPRDLHGHLTRFLAM